MPDAITHLIYYSITIQAAALPFGFRGNKKGEREQEGEGLLFVFNYLKQPHVPSREKVLQHSQSLSETTVVTYWIS